MKINSKYYLEINNMIRKAERPIVLVNAATHGDERVGLAVQKALEKIKIIKGSLFYTVGNPGALQRNTRYIDMDLNRVFPGKKTGNYEERLAYNLNPIIKVVDVVIDIHSTTSSLKDAVIVTKRDEATQGILGYIPARYILIMGATKNSSLISSARIGLGLEFGKDKTRATLRKSTRAVKEILRVLGMVSGKKPVSTKPIYLSVLKGFKKIPGYKLSRGIDNYKLIRQGQIVATNGNNNVVAEEDFYPVLFGNKTYKEIFGFMAKKIK